MEKEEAFSLRDAMDDMSLGDTPKDVQVDDDESRIYNAALDEASELVYRHQNPQREPQPDAPYRYRPHLRKNSYAHARTASAGRYGEDIAASGMARDVGSRSVSGSSSGSDAGSRRSRPSVDSARANTKPYGSVGSRPGVHPDRRRSSMRRNVSGEVERPFSGDQIWEEPESASTPGSAEAGRASPDKLSSRPQNPSSRVRFQSSREDAGAVKPLDRVEIYRNPPSRSRDALYTSNKDLPASPADESIERKNGVEVRGEEIRNATSMRLKDRSSKLPEPTAVSDSPGRPIVSFNANWKAPEESTDFNPEHQANVKPKSQPRCMEIPTISVAEDPSPRAQPPTNAHLPPGSLGGSGASRASARPLPTVNVPTIAVDEAPRAPNIPTIVAPNDNASPPVPSINIPGISVDEPAGDGNVPAIVTPDDAPAQSSRRALPHPGRAQRPQSHWSRAPDAAARSKTHCHECGLHIEGRFVALRGGTNRFHPQCLMCYTCGTNLQAMEISPEPDNVREERLSRIARRAAGEVLDETPGMTMAEDGDERLRFYCHLDWHEFFAPRCRHCKTPILGEHIVALGEHWHYGHFFCAECGDPFEHGMTHIEKDGYAWCIKCQTKRTERRAPKCRRCRTAVIGEYIQALGHEWHEACFRCAECQGSFDDGQIFPKEIPGGTVVLCTACRASELKR